MATKNNPGDWDCLAKLADDEPFFVLRGKDPRAAPLIELWVALTERLGLGDMPEKPGKLGEALACAAHCRAYAFTHGAGVMESKVPEFTYMPTGPHAPHPSEAELAALLGALEADLPFAAWLHTLRVIGRWRRFEITGDRAVLRHLFEQGFSPQEVIEREIAAESRG